MIENKMTEYTIDLPSRRRTIRVYGDDTDENRNKAEDEFIRQIKNDIGNDWIEIIDAVTETDYEVPYKEAI